MIVFKRTPIAARLDELLDALQRAPLCGKSEEEQLELIVEILMTANGVMCEVLERDRSLLEWNLKDEAEFVGKAELPDELQHGLRNFNLVSLVHNLRCTQNIHI